MQFMKMAVKQSKKARQLLYIYIIIYVYIYMYIIRLKHWKFPRLTMLDCTAGNAPSTNPPCLDYTAGFEPAPQTNMRPGRRHVHHVLLPSRPLGSWQPEREST